MSVFCICVPRSALCLVGVTLPLTKVFMLSNDLHLLAQACLGKKARISINASALYFHRVEHGIKSHFKQWD